MNNEIPEFSEDLTLSDIELITQDSMYLIHQRVENLREMIQPSLDEIVELKNLESLLKTTGSSDDTPEDLVVPGKTDQLIAALEAKRVNRDDDRYYDGGIDENDESGSSVNQSYMGLLRESWLNPKSMTLLSKEKMPVPNHKYNGKNRTVTIFDLYETSPPKLTFSEFLAKIWKTTEDGAGTRLEKESKGDQWNLKAQWKGYLEHRESKTPSPYQQVLLRCHDLATSPIYEDMKKIGEEHYVLECGCEFRFTDKTIVFTIPVTELEDIPKKREFKDVAFLQAAFILPENAHERKRFFRKGGTVKELAVYLYEFNTVLSEKQIGFLNDLIERGALRLYREALELPDKDEIRGYFLSFRKGCHNIGNRIRERLRQNENLLVHHVTRLSTWYPEWMRKIEGLIVEEREGKSLSVQKPLRMAVDDRLPKHSYKRESTLMPSWNLNHAMLPKEKWEAAFVGEMREAYKRNPQVFMRYAEDIAGKKAELHCGCHKDNGNTIHEEKCPVPVLEEIFRKIKQERQ